jgi:hypothetical protein
MDRRKAIFGIILGATGVAGSTFGYGWWKLYRSPDLDWLEQNRILIGELAETIIPRTDSPGAKDAAVDNFIIKMIRDCTPRKEQNNFLDGLKDLQEFCRRKYGLAYPDCSEAQQHQTLEHFEQAAIPLQGRAGKVMLRLTGRPFFRILKDYTVEGYCTSEPGATTGLAYLYIPGSFHGCIPLQKNQKAWATN